MIDYSNDTLMIVHKVNEDFIQKTLALNSKNEINNAITGYMEIVKKNYIDQKVVFDNFAALHIKIADMNKTEYLKFVELQKESQKHEVDVKEQLEFHLTPIDQVDILSKHFKREVDIFELEFGLDSVEAFYVRLYPPKKYKTYVDKYGKSLYTRLARHQELSGKISNINIEPKTLNSPGPITPKSV